MRTIRGMAGELFAVLLILNVLWWGRVLIAWLEAQ